MLHGHPSSNRGWEHEWLGFPAPLGDVDKVGNGCLDNQLTTCASEGKRYRVNVTDNLRQFESQGSSTDSDSANPSVPEFLSCMEFRMKTISHELGVDVELELSREGLMGITHCRVKDILGWGNDRKD